MANMLESYGLSFFEEDEETLMGVISYTAKEGREFYSYHGAPYLYKNMGFVEFWVSTILDQEGKYCISEFHTHCSGNNIWEMTCTGIDLSYEDYPKAERILLVKKTGGDDSLLPVEFFNADVLPSFLKGGIIKAQIVAPCMEINYYASESEYEESIPEIDGKKWLIADGSLMPIQFLYNHNPERYENGQYYENDKYISFRATVKAVYKGFFKIDGKWEFTFLRCLADTQFGELEFHHSIDQVPEEMQDNIKAGSTVTGTCILSADVAIDGYEKGIIKDPDHNLKLVRYSMEQGDSERLRTVLTDSSVYKTETSGKEYHGPDEIINQFEFVHTHRDDKYISHLAEITSPNKEYAVGTRCIILADGQPDNYESIVFVTTDEDGNISNIKVSTDREYKFKICEAAS